MRRIRATVWAFVLCIAVGTLKVPAASAAIALAAWGFNINGMAYCDTGPCDFDVGVTGHLSGPGGLPALINRSGFSFGTGLGALTITWSPNAAGTYFIGAFVDHEIDEPTNTFFNEFGAANGTLATGQSWEIDEPCGLACGFFGDIFDNFLARTFDERIGTSIFGNTTFPDDVSMALGWNFALASGELARIHFLVSQTPPSSGFFLSQTDPDSDVTIYFSGGLTIQPSGPVAIPEPATWVLLGSGLLGLVAWGRHQARARSCHPPRSTRRSIVMPRMAP